MAKWAEALAVKAEDLSLIPRIRMMEGRTNSHRLSSELHRSITACMCLHTHTHRYKHKKIKAFSVSLWSETTWRLSSLEHRLDVNCPCLSPPSLFPVL